MVEIKIGEGNVVDVKELLPPQKKAFAWMVGFMAGCSGDFQTTPVKLSTTHEELAAAFCVTYWVGFKQMPTYVPQRIRDTGDHLYRITLPDNLPFDFSRLANGGWVDFVAKEADWMMDDEHVGLALGGYGEKRITIGDPRDKCRIMIGATLESEVSFWKKVIYGFGVSSITVNVGSGVRGDSSELYVSNLRDAQILARNLNLITPDKARFLNAYKKGPERVFIGDKKILEEYELVMSVASQTPRLEDGSHNLPVIKGKLKDLGVRLKRDQVRRWVVEGRSPHNYGNLWRTVFDLGEFESDYQQAMSVPEQPTNTIKVQSDVDVGLDQVFTQSDLTNLNDDQIRVCIDAANLIIEVQEYIESGQSPASFHELLESSVTNTRQSRDYLELTRCYDELEDMFELRPEAG